VLALGLVSHSGLLFPKTLLNTLSLRNIEANLAFWRGLLSLTEYLRNESFALGGDTILITHKPAFANYTESMAYRCATSLIAAGQNRVRLITMTTLAAILTLLPLAFAIGQGSEMQQPLAIAIISGLIVQLPLVLGVMPVLFSLTQRRSFATGG
jgi:Cu/Ag efflux pump CusA